MPVKKSTKNPLTDKKYSGKWIALSPDKKRVLSSGKTFQQMKKSLDPIEKVIFFRVPHFGKIFAPLAL